MGTEVWAYLALIMFVLLILIGIVQYSRKMYRMKVDRWKRYAENRGLLHRTGGAWGLGEMVGEVQGRQVKISAVTQNTRTFERMSAGTRVDILLHDSMNALYFRWKMRRIICPLWEPQRCRSEMMNSTLY